MPAGMFGIMDCIGIGQVECAHDDCHVRGETILDESIREEAVGA